MPNHTTNHLLVEGNANDLAEMRSFVMGDDEVFSFNSIIPMPEELRGTTKGFGMAHNETLEETHEREQREAKLVDRHGFDNWYDWSVANWNTKWDAYPMSDLPLEWEERRNGLYIEFFTAWSPPLSVIAALANKFPTLRFSLDYSDEGGGYAGQFVCEGSDLRDECFDDPVLIEAKNREMFGEQEGE